MIDDSPPRTSSSRGSFFTVDMSLGFWAPLWVCLGLFSGNLGAAPCLQLTDASGVARHGPALLVVDDECPGTYFEYRLNGHRGPSIPLETRRLETVALPNARLATDLEAIDVLGDGRVVVLSERLRALCDAQGIVAEYDVSLGEFGKRGLEGLAVHRMADHSSRVAVLWEGGYPEVAHVQSQMNQLNGPFRPLVLVHTLRPGESGVKTTSVEPVELDVPIPPGSELPRGEWFRAPDLVWDRVAGDNSGFIVLLSSTTPHGTRRFSNHWLQRFSTRGEQVGDPIDLDQIAPEELKGVNWEGVGWFEAGRSLVLVHENHPTSDSTAYVLQLPEEWKSENETEEPAADDIHRVPRQSALVGIESSSPAAGTLGGIQ